MDSHGFPKTRCGHVEGSPNDSTRFTERLHMVRAIGFAQDLHRALRKLQSILFNDFTCRRNPDSQVRIGRSRSMEYGTYMEFTNGIYIWNPYGIVEL